MIAEVRYANLTTEDWIQRFNSYDPSLLPDTGSVNVTLNCSCGSSSISKDYGLFLTYPLRPGETLDSVSSEANLSSELIRSYNPDVDFNKGSGLIYIPGRDENGNYPPLKTITSSEPGLSGGAIGGITAGVVAVVLFLSVCLYNGVYRKKNAETSSVLLQNSQVQLVPAHENVSKRLNSKTAVDTVVIDQSHQTKSTSIKRFRDPQAKSNKTTIINNHHSPTINHESTVRYYDIMSVQKSVEFSYEELSTATHDFSLVNKIGQGGFGAVYYAELRGEKAAIKKMDMQASPEFLAELKVLTHVHHPSLVPLIGYCVEGSLCLVYEYMENGNLSQHLHGTGRDPLPWSTRIQVALDSARGLEYIHEHTVPVYIHCDIKSANILIDKNFHGKVADFGLATLTTVGATSRVVGTFGYMPPEYVQYGDFSPKVDVHAFGVVLYELISAKQAIIRANDSDDEPKSLIAVFDEVLSQVDPKENLVKLIDPRLGDNYPLDSVHKMAQLAKACTHEDPRLRPSMRSVVVALMTLSSSSMEDCGVGSFYENQTLVGLKSTHKSLHIDQNSSLYEAI